MTTPPQPHHNPHESTQSGKSERYATWQVLVGGTLISFSPIFVHLASMGPVAIAFYRLFFAGLILLSIVLITRKSLWCGWQPMIYITFAALFFSSEMVVWNMSIDIVGPGVATVLKNLQVFILVFIGIVLFDETFNRRFLIAVALVIVGLIFLFGHHWYYFGLRYHHGIAEGLLAALFYALFTLSLRRTQSHHTQSLSPIANMMYICLISAVMLWITAKIQGESLVIPNATNWVVLVGYAIVSQALGWLTISRGLPHVRISLAGVFLLLQPTLSFIWDIIIFKRPTRWFEVVGVLIILLAIYLDATTRHKPVLK